jgi:sec-independent protein translocase protein TatC
MRNFFSGAWRAVTFPFRLLFNILAFPFRKYAQFHKFLNTEPEERPLADAFVELTTNQDARQAFWEQIGVLRSHLLRSIIVLAIAVFVSFAFSRDLSALLASPLGEEMNLEAIEITEGISVFMKIALMAGIVISVPYIVFELWMFAAPGLRPREKKYSLVGIPLAALLFAGGVVFTYFILPAAFGAIREFNTYMGFDTNWRPNSYYGFVLNLMLWMGIFFEFPLIIYVLSSMGLVNPDALRKQWRLAVVIISIIAAAITPTVDPVNMGLVMVPMIVLYFLSISLGQIAYAGRMRRVTEAQVNAADEQAG